MRSRRGAALLVALTVVVINLPLLHSSWLDWRLDRNGVDVDATVTDSTILPPEDDAKYVVQFRFNREVDPVQQSWTAQVDEATYDDATDTDEIRVRVLPERPSAYRAVGQVSGRLGLVITLFADVVLLAMVLLLWRYRRPGSRPGASRELQMVATADVERCKPASSRQLLADGRYVVCGEVTGITDDGLVLDVGDATVQVDLAGHANPVGYQQPARVMGRLLG